MDTPQVRRSDMLALVAGIDRRHTLRLTADAGDLVLLEDPRDTPGHDAPVTVLARAEATRRRAIELALRVTRDPRKLSQSFLGAVQRKLGDTQVQTLEKLASHYGL